MPSSESPTSANLTFALCRACLVWVVDPSADSALGNTFAFEARVQRRLAEDDSSANRASINAKLFVECLVEVATSVSNKKTFSELPDEIRHITQLFSFRR